MEKIYIYIYVTVKPSILVKSSPKKLKYIDTCEKCVFFFNYVTRKILVNKIFSKNVFFFYYVKEKKRFHVEKDIYFYVIVKTWSQLILVIFGKSANLKKLRFFW